MSADDQTLVWEYTHTGSERAFSLLVSRHIHLVYSVVLRQVRDAHLAEEVTQDVFILLARKAPSLKPDTIVAGWLCRAARNISANALTVQRRRQNREQQAAMESPANESDHRVWTQIEPLLETAMAQLRKKDFDAVVLRFFEARSFQDIGAALDTTEAGAKMRVGRALEKLRQFFAHQGLHLSAADIASAVAAYSVHDAPTSLTISVTAAVAQGKTPAFALSPLTKTALKIMAWSKLKTSIAVGVFVLLAAGTASVALRHGGLGSDASPFAFAGYATPENAVQSTLWAASRGDLTIFTTALTTDQADQFKGMMAGKSEGEIKQSLISWASAMKDFTITQKDVVSPDEVHLHLHATPSVDALRTGKAVIVMQRIGNEWKKAGDVR